MPAAIGITGINTDVGKTVVSSLLAEALGADYWKPVQTGAVQETDAAKVRRLVSHDVTIHHEAFVLKAPLSPHAAALLEGTAISMKDIVIPETGNILIVEMAGGVLSPIDDKHTMCDFLHRHAIPAILVVKHYLGSINHTLSSLEALQKRNIKLYGIIVNGAPDRESEEFIRYYAGANILAYVPWLDCLTPDTITTESILLKNHLKTSLGKWLV